MTTTDKITPQEIRRMPGWIHPTNTDGSPMTPPQMIKATHGATIDEALAMGPEDVLGYVKDQWNSGNRLFIHLAAGHTITKLQYEIETLRSKE